MSSTASRLPWFAGLLCLFWAALPSAHAEERLHVGQYDVVRWTTADGLPSNVVRALAQTPDGFLWVGSWNGLARFDGARFEVFDLSNTPALGDIAISCLQVDRAGTLWIGTQGGTISRYRDGRFESVASHLPSGPRALGMDAEGTVWVGGHVCLGTEGQGLLVLKRRHVRRLPAGVEQVVPTDQGALWLRVDGVPTLRDRDGSQRARLIEFAGATISRARGGGIWLAHERGYARRRHS